MTARVIAPPDLTTYETAVLAQLSGEPKPVEVIASRAGLTRSDARLGINGLVATGAATLLGGSGYVLASAPRKAARPTRRTGDIIEERFALLVGDAEERLGVLAAGSVDAMVMSSPYWKERDYGVPGQLGWERTPEEFVARLVNILCACKRALAPHGLLFFNFDDHVDHGRQSCLDAKLVTKLEHVGLDKFREIIWHKTAKIPNGTDNAPGHAYEKIFVLKHHGEKHYWDTFAAREEAKTGGMKRIDDVWTFPPAVSGHSRGGHFAAFPPELVTRAISVGVSERGYCAKCGAPWVRKLSRGRSTWSEVGATYRQTRDDSRSRGKAETNVAKDANGKSVDLKMAEMRHVGWAPSCLHRRGPTRRPLIADPFLGSGTTGIVAMQRGFDFFGIDINPTYVQEAAVDIRAAAEGSPR